MSQSFLFTVRSIHKYELNIYLEIKEKTVAFVADGIRTRAFDCFGGEAMSASREAAGEN